MQNVLIKKLHTVLGISYSKQDVNKQFFRSVTTSQGLVSKNEKYVHHFFEKIRSSHIDTKRSKIVKNAKRSEFSMETMFVFGSQKNLRVRRKKFIDY